MRDILNQFANAMENQLQLNDHKGHYGWFGEEKKLLLKKLAAEILELSLAVAGKNREHIKSEACDVANYAMMIWDDRSDIHGGD